jgi:Icc-related predicted phosphoesterase
MNYRLYISIISLLFLQSCQDAFDYSPYIIDFSDDDKQCNIKNIRELNQASSDDSTIRIAITGDTHRDFDELEEFVNSVNMRNNNTPLDFVIHVGDFADFGLPKQYLWSNSSLKKLDCPYIVNLGNHDLVGNGGQAYTEMYGDYNFSFIYKKIKFVFINTNGREFSFAENIPDIQWLDHQLTPSNNFLKAIVVFHVPPMDVDFNPDLENSFHSTIAKYNNVLLAIHGHLHHYSLYKPYADSVDYLNVYGLENLKYNIVTITNNQFKVSSHDI